MFGLTNLGVIHTAFSLIAVFAGLVAFAVHHGISLKSCAGRIYVFTTVITCLTGFGIFRHGFGAPHILGIITLIVLRIAVLAGQKKFGKAGPYIETVGYSLTFFFHMIPALTEGGTRIPTSAPFFDSRESPDLQMAVGICFVLFLIGATVQVLHLRKQPVAPPAPVAEEALPA